MSGTATADFGSSRAIRSWCRSSRVVASSSAGPKSSNSAGSPERIERAAGCGESIVGG